MKKLILLAVFITCQSQLLFSQKKVEFEREIKQHNNYNFAKIKTANTTDSEILIELAKQNKSVAYQLIENKRVIIILLNLNTNFTKMA